MISFPTIPEVETGQVLSATVLNSYHKGVRHLLGRSHEPVTLQHCHTSATYFTSWKRMYSWWLPYRGDRISYHYTLSTSNAGKIAYLELRYVGDDTNEHVVLADDTTGDTTGAGVFTAGVDYGTSMTAGTVYEWRLYAKGDDGSNNSVVNWWELSSYTNAVTGWVTPPTIVASATSAAADLNKFRTDINALKTYRLDVAKGLSVAPAIKYTSGSTSWIEAARFCYRYRPESLRANVYCEMTPGVGVYWQYRVSAMEWGGASFTVLYTQATSTKFSNVTTGGEWGVEAAIDVGAGLVGVALGDWVQIKIEILSSAPGNLSCNGYYLNRYSTGTPAAGWQALTDWAEGDADAGPTNLNKISTDLTMLYASGAEELWGYTHATGMGGNTVDDGDANQLRHSGVHLHRWLHYKPASGETPTVYYGPNLTRTLTLGTESGWQAFDLQGSELAPGAVYQLTGCEGAFEDDDATL
jgi:hypothetical protein